MYGNRGYGRPEIRFGITGGPPPRDLLAILIALFVTFSLQYFDVTSKLLILVELTPLVWRLGFLWQLATYAFVGARLSPLFFLLELFMIFMFGRDVFRALGRAQFWKLLAWAGLAASVVAAAVAALFEVLGGMATLPQAPFAIIQGQHILTVIFIAAFAVLYGNATIYFMFILPIRARWFLWLEVLLGFMAFLTTKDFAGFLGLCAAVAATWMVLTGQGIRRLLKEWRLRLERLVLEQRLRRMQRHRRFDVLDGGGQGGNGKPWVH